MPKQKMPGSKDDTKNVSVEEKIGRSPDTGDAVVQLFHAVRILHDLNEFFRYYERPLTMWPDSSLEGKTEKVSPAHPFQKQEGQSPGEFIWSLGKEEIGEINTRLAGEERQEHIPWWMTETSKVESEEQAEDGKRKWHNDVLFGD